MGDMRNVAERVSEGRSGSFFYYSHDGKFMVKTVSRAEVRMCLLWRKAPWSKMWMREGLLPRSSTLQRQGLHAHSQASSGCFRGWCVSS